MRDPLYKLLNYSSVIWVAYLDFSWDLQWLTALNTFYAHFPQRYTINSMFTIPGIKLWNLPWHAISVWWQIFRWWRVANKIINRNYSTKTLATKLISSNNQKSNKNHQSVPRWVFKMMPDLWESSPIRRLVEAFENPFQSSKHSLKAPLTDNQERNYKHPKINSSRIEPSSRSSRFEVTIRNLEPPPSYQSYPNGSRSSYNSSVHD